MLDFDNHMAYSSLFEEPSVRMALSQAIHDCLEHIWQQFHIRARLFLYEEGELILKARVGAYRFCPELGLKVHPGSIVWEIFKKGSPANLTESTVQKERPHTLPDPIDIKAVIPLRVMDITEGRKLTLGVLVLDSGDSPEPIEDRDFRYLQIIGLLISEILLRFFLVRRIEKVQREKEKIAQEVAHVVRNRFTAIGGSAQQLQKSLRDPTARRWLTIIMEEVKKGEEASERWLK